ncbi:unnamed protein product [Sphagnum jensenii]
MIDNQLIFDQNVALTVSAASTNTIDLLANTDLGAMYPIELHCDVTTAFTAAGAATLTIALQTSTDNVNWYTILISPEAYPVAALTVGAAIMRYPVPLNQLANGTIPGRYLRLYYTIATGPMTAGALYSYLSADREVRYPYPKNYTAA